MVKFVFKYGKGLKLLLFIWLKSIYLSLISEPSWSMFLYGKVLKTAAQTIQSEIKSKIALIYFLYEFRWFLLLSEIRNRRFAWISNLTWSKSYYKIKREGTVIFIIYSIIFYKRTFWCEEQKYPGLSMGSISLRKVKRDTWLLLVCFLNTRICEENFSQ